MTDAASHLNGQSSEANCSRKFSLQLSLVSGKPLPGNAKGESVADLFKSGNVFMTHPVDVSSNYSLML
jgi:hypothetical protein